MTPTTKAGRAMLVEYHDRMHDESCDCPAEFIAEHIIAIEREAAAEAVALRAALERIRDFEATVPIDEWAEAAAFTAVQDIARAALATPAPAAPAEPER